MHGEGQQIDTLDTEGCVYGVRLANFTVCTICWWIQTKPSYLWGEDLFFNFFELSLWLKTMSKIKKKTHLYNALSS